MLTSTNDSVSSSRVAHAMRGRGRSGYGWVVVAISAFGLLFGAFPIVVSSFAIFLRSYAQEFHAGRAAISLALTIHNCVAAFLAVWIGRLSDRFGPRRVILPGLGILGLVLLSAQEIGSKVWQLYIFYAMLGAVSNTTTSVPYSVIVSRWFNRRRGLALGLTQVGLGLGAIVMPALVHLLIARYGWRSAFAISGGAVWIIAMPMIALFLKEAPLPEGSLVDSASGQIKGLDWDDIRKARIFWLMITSFVLVGASVQACVIHIAALLSDRGAPAALATLAVSVVGLAMLAGRAGTGYFLDRYFGPRVALVLFAMAALGMALLATGVTGKLALLSVFMVGLAFGAELDIIAYLISRYFGLRALGTAFGVAFGSFVLAGGIGPLLMGFAFDRTGSYRAAIAGFSIATMLAAVLVGRLGPYRFALSQAAGKACSGIEE
jgi:MFS family permease